MAAVRSPRVRQSSKRHSCPATARSGRPETRASSITSSARSLRPSQIFGGADDERPIAQGSEQRIGVVETTRHGHRRVGERRGLVVAGGRLQREHRPPPEQRCSDCRIVGGQLLIEIGQPLAGGRVRNERVVVALAGDFDGRQR